MKTNVILMAAVVCATAANAGGWRFSAGPAWRSEVKMEAKSGTVTPVGGTGAIAYDYNPATDGWTPDQVTETRRDPRPSTPGDELWAVSGHYTETSTTPDGGASGEDSSLGLKAKVGYDFFENETFSVGLDLRFAAYWDLKSGFSGSSRRVTDWWLFTGGPYPEDPTGSRDFTHSYLDPDDECSPYEPYREYGAWGASNVRGRMKADLYQVGLGPTVTWHAFSWLDAYAGVAALANIAALDFEAGASKASETQCRLGFASEVGLAAYVTENLGLYAEVGYEWVDDFDASAGGLSADVDFSALVISAGVAFRF